MHLIKNKATGEYYNIDNQPAKAWRNCVYILEFMAFSAFMLSLFFVYMAFA